jgi:hypothetical protein
MKNILFILIIASYFQSCDRPLNYTEQVPKCNDSIPVKITKDLIRQTFAAIKMANSSRNYADCYQILDDYKLGKKYDTKLDEQIKNAIASADSVDFRIEDILPTNIDEKLKKCDCNASLIVNEHKIPISYSAQNIDEGTYVSMKSFFENLR